MTKKLTKNILLIAMLLCCYHLRASKAKSSTFSLNEKNHEGGTLIHYAVKHHSTKCLKVMLDKSDYIDLSVKNDENKTALEMAKAKGFDDMVKLLEDYASKQKAQGDDLILTILKKGNFTIKK